MKLSTVISALTVMVVGVSARPHRNWQPAGGWKGVNFQDFDWSNVPFDRVDWTQINWSRVPYATFPWNQITWGNVGLWQWQSASPSFSVSQTVIARPGLVVVDNTAAVALRPRLANDTAQFTPTGGLPGARGVFQFGLLPTLNAICYNIAIKGFTGDYQSPATTATHLHEGVSGQTGPLRIAFPNPVATSSTSDKRVSIGCLRGPFTTGIFVNGSDTGSGFTVNQIQQNGSNFYADIHSSNALAGAVRGQLSSR